ncbi:MAG: MutS-related protein [Acidimicrobiales bacterium]
MKAHLLHRDRDLAAEPALPRNEAELTQDLELGILLDAMAGGDEYLYAAAGQTLLTSLTDAEAIAYRQAILQDCIAQPAVVRQIYAIAVEAASAERSVAFSFVRYPAGILRRSIRLLDLLVPLLRQLRALAGTEGDSFGSEGLTTLCAMLRHELDDEYFAELDEHLRRLRFRGGLMMSAVLGDGNKGIRHVLRTPLARTAGWKERFGIGRPPSHSFQIHPRDEAGARALSELNDRGVNLVANALAQSTDHVLSFFVMLRRELGFYVSCLNLHDRLAERGEPVCVPAPLPVRPHCLVAQGIYDVSLALQLDGPVVGNTVDATGLPLVMITGANSGGKSTFLRSVGLAQLMMQCGMFVGAESFSSSLCMGTFTHFIREEDATMTSGRLDEELRRMSSIVDELAPDCLVLMNESFSSTTEREGSEIGRQVIAALLDCHVRVICVTHLFTLASDCHDQMGEKAIFLRAERQADGRRTFKLVEGAPLSTSHGEDLYERVFAESPRP